MRTNMNACRQILRQFLAVGLCSATLAGCGGGGGSAGTNNFSGGGTTGTGAGSITLELTNSAGAVSNTVTSANTLIAKATVRDSKGAPVKDAVVTFTVGSILAEISPASGTALSDGNGVAQVGIKSAGKGSGATTVTASAATGGAAEVTASKAFSIGATATATATAINFVSAVPNDYSIVIKGAGGNGRTEVALLTFQVVDSSNSGVPNQPITFSAQSSRPVTLTAESGITDAGGNVTVAVNSGSDPTTVRVVAVVQGTGISGQSDTVTVSTGQPVQTAFSISAEKSFVEGMNYDNTPNLITVLLADVNGGAVADGTQVVFTTDGGAIVGSGGARCLTIDGACTVTWRSQNPRPASGVVTVTATATNSTGGLSTSRSFFMSGSFPRLHVISPAGAQASPGGAINYDFGTTCNPVTFSVQLDDTLNNPLPEQTTLTVANASNGSATVAPASVLYDGRNIIGGEGGTRHDVKLTPASCTGSGIQKTGSLDLTVRTPLGGPVSVPLSFTFLAAQ